MLFLIDREAKRRLYAKAYYEANRPQILRRMQIKYDLQKRYCHYCEKRVVLNDNHYNTFKHKKKTILKTLQGLSDSEITQIFDILCDKMLYDD